MSAQRPRGFGRIFRRPNRPDGDLWIAYYSHGGEQRESVKKALGKLTAPVLICAGELDNIPTLAAVARGARLFPRCEVVVQPAAGHFPWLDDPAWFTAAIDSFLG